MQVLNFVQKFVDLLPDYEIACEHEHSNCVLIAHEKVCARDDLKSIVIAVAQTHLLLI